jgi:hypothetical protein
MEAMRKSWTDERLDHFAEKVDRRFDEVDRRFQEVDRRFDKVDHELRRINDRLDGLTKAMFFGTVTMSTSVLAGFVAVAFTTA